MIEILGTLMLWHLIGMIVPALGMAVGDLWQGESYRQQMMKLLGWEWWLVKELVGE
jgi:hypothetical protein